MPPMGGLDLLFERVDQRLEALHLGLCGLGPNGLGVGLHLELVCGRGRPFAGREEIDVRLISPDTAQERVSHETEG